MTHTLSHTRAIVAFLLLAASALVSSRLEFLVLSAPFATYLIMALWRSSSADPQVSVEVSPQRVQEEDPVTVSAKGGEHSIVTLSVPTPRASALNPRFGMRAGQSTVHVTVRPHTFGAHSLGPFIVHTSDPLASLRYVHRVQDIPVTVVPRSHTRARARRLEHVLGVSGPHASRKKGEGTALADVREYRLGDRLKRINWKVTSRKGVLHSNETESERDTDVIMVMDTAVDITGVGPATGEREPSSVEAAVEAVTALSRHYLAVGDRVSVVDLGGRLQSLPLAAGPGQLRRILDSLSSIDRAARLQPPQARMRPVRSGSLVYVCTPLLLQDVIGVVGSLRAHGADVSVIDTLPASLSDISRLTGRPMRKIEGFHDTHMWDEAWAIRSLERRFTITRLAAHGIKVNRWEDAL